MARIIKCPICETEFEFNNKGNRQYCCDECRRIAKKAQHRKAELKRRTHYVKKCPICGITFETTRGNKMYCCYECKRKSGSVYQFASQRVHKSKAFKPKKVNIEDRCKCKLLKKCAYTCYMGGNGKNGTPYCGFMEITGHMRGGYPDECTHYRERERKNGNRNSTDMYSTDCAWK